MTPFRLVAAVAMLPIAAFADLSYTIQDLGATATNTLVVPLGLSSNGAHATGSQNPSWTWNSPSGITSLTTATGLNWQEARGINSSGTVVGYSSSFGPGGQQALWWDGTTFRQFKPSGASSAQAWGISDAGIVMGTAFASGGRVFAWDPATNTSTYLSGTGQTIFSATGNGSATGFFVGSGGAQQAIRVDGGIGGLTMTALNSPLGADYARGIGLNDNSMVVGYTGLFTSGATNAILWNGTTPTILPALAGRAQNRAADINNAGTVVGMSRGSSFSGSSAVVWQSGLVYDLSLLVTNPIAGVRLDYATAISENGKILVQGRDGSNAQRAYLLTPAPPTTAVPEPSTFTFAALAGTLILLRKRKR